LRDRLQARVGRECDILRQGVEKPGPVTGATCAVADEALAIWSSEAPGENQYKLALLLPKQDFYSFKVHAVRTFDPPPRRRPQVSEVGLPVEVGSNIEVEALLVSGRRGLA